MITADHPVPLILFECSTLMELLTIENQEFEGRNNAYLFVDDGDVTIVGTGIARPDIRDQLET